MTALDQLEAQAPALCSVHQSDVAEALSAALAWADEARAAGIHRCSEFASAVRRTEVFAALMQNPFYTRAYEKPRGYAGDAVTMDFVYGCGESAGTLAAATPVGRRLGLVDRSFRTVRAACERTLLAAAAIEAACASRPAPRIVSIGAGHARELALVSPISRAALAEFHAVDQDPASLARLAQDSHSAVAPFLHERSVGSLIRGAPFLEGVDLVYCMGVLDYLPERVGRALLRAMHEMLAPGGRLLVANFAPNTQLRSFAEVFLDWWMVYRDETELLALLEGTGATSPQIFRDTTGDLVLMAAERTAAPPPPLASRSVRKDRPPLPPNTFASTPGGA